MKKAIKKKMSIEDLSLTIKDLSLSMNKGFKRVENKIDTVVDLVDKLAISTLGGFEKVDKRFEGLETKMKTGFEGVDKRIDDFAETKASKITYKELDNRVGFIEKKLEIKK